MMRRAAEAMQAGREGSELSERPNRGPSEPQVTVIVVVHNAGEHLAPCLAALQAQTFGDFEAIVCDNASTDGAFAAAASATTDPRIRFIAFGANLGFATANNRAAAMARGTWLALLNPDALAEPDWLAELLAATVRHPETAMFASLQIDAADDSRLDGAGDVLSAWGIPWRGGHGRALVRPAEGECFSACGAAAFYRREQFEALGGFADAFFCFCEDVDLGFRDRLAGGRTLLIPTARVRHWGGASTGRRSAFALYHGARNRLWTFLRCMPGPLLWPLLPCHLAATLMLLSIAVLRGEGGPFLRGLIDALRALPGIWRQRRAVQATRVAPLRDIAAALTWSPWQALRRDVAVMPLTAAAAATRTPVPRI